MEIYEIYEPHAIRKYTHIITKSRSHKNFHVEVVGLVIDKRHPYIAVTPARLGNSM
jgi:hypothetical protein